MSLHTDTQARKCFPRHPVSAVIYRSFTVVSYSQKPESLTTSLIESLHVKYWFHLVRLKADPNMVWKRLGR